MSMTEEIPFQSDEPMELELLGGYLHTERDPETKKETGAVILYDRVLVRHIDGEDEDILAKKNVPVRARIEGIVMNCVTTLLPAKGEVTADGNPARPITDAKTIRAAVQQLPANDRPYILVSLRAHTVGPIFWYDLNCPNPKCQAELKKSTDLRTLEKKRMVNPKERSYDVDLGQGNTARMKIMTGNDEVKLEELGETSEDEFTNELLVRTLLINGEPPDARILKKLTSQKRMRMRWAFNEREPDLETKVRHKCSSCNREFALNLGIGSPDFFFPSATQNPWSTKSGSGSKLSEEPT